MNYERNKIRNLAEAKQRVRQIILANFGKNHYYCTFTFRENVRDPAVAYRAFTDFMREYKRRSGKRDLKYLAVPERQKRGAIHFHAVFNFKPYKYRKVEVYQLWRYGAVKVCKIYEIEGLGRYLIKYLTKDFIDLDVGGKHYLRSRGLHNPYKEYYDHAMDNIGSDARLICTKKYLTKFAGSVIYQLYKHDQLPF